MRHFTDSSILPLIHGYAFCRFHGENLPCPDEWYSNIGHDNSFSIHHEMSHRMTKPTKWPVRQRRLRSAWASAQSDQSSLFAWRWTGSLADAQANLSLCWAHMPFWWFCHATAQIAEYKMMQMKRFIVGLEIFKHEHTCMHPPANRIIQSNI